MKISSGCETPSWLRSIQRGEVASRHHHGIDRSVVIAAVDHISDMRLIPGCQLIEAVRAVR